MELNCTFQNYAIRLRPSSAIFEQRIYLHSLLSFKFLILLYVSQIFWSRVGVFEIPVLAEGSVHRYDMYPFYLATLLLLSVLPQHILAVEGGRQVKQDLAPQVKQALPPIGNTLYTMYNKNIDAMKRHHKEMTTLDKQRRFWNKGNLKRQRLRLGPQKLMQARKEVRLAERQAKRLREKHFRAWQKASDAAGSQHIANQFMHRLNPKDITPTQNPGRDALRLVADRAGTQWIEPFVKARSHGRKSATAHKQILDLELAELQGQSVKKQDMKRLQKELGKNEVLASSYRYQAMRNLYVNRVLDLTVKGVNRAPVKNSMVKAAASWSKAYPFWPWQAPKYQDRD